MLQSSIKEVKEINLDGYIITAGNSDGSFKVFDIITRKTIVSIKRHQGHKNFCISVNGKYQKFHSSKYVAAGFIGFALIWNIKTRKYQKLQPKSENVMNIISEIQIDPNSQYVVTLEFDQARLWDAETGKEIKQFIAISQVHVQSLQFNPVGDKLIICSHNHARIWNVQSGNCIHILRRHTGEVRCSQFDSSGDYCATGDSSTNGRNDSTCKIWDVKTGKCIQTLPVHTKRIINLSFNQSGSRIVTVSQDGSGRVYNVQTGELVLLFGQNYKIKKAQFFQTTNLIIAQRGDEKAIVFAENGECLQEFEKTSNYSLNQQENTLLTISKQGELRIWKNFQK